MPHEISLPNGTIETIRIAHGKKVWSTKYQKLVPQPEYLPKDHHEMRTLAQLAKWLPSPISIPADAEGETLAQLKGAIPLWFPGGLKQKGENGGDSCRRKAVNMAPTKLIVFDLDECTPQAYNALTAMVLPEFSAISYTTPSDKPEARRVRIIIELDRHVMSGADGKGICSSLIMQDLMTRLNATPVAEDRGVWMLGGGRIAFDMSVHDAEQYLIRPHKESELKLFSGCPVDVTGLTESDFLDEVMRWGVTGKKTSENRAQLVLSDDEMESVGQDAQNVYEWAAKRGFVQVNESTFNVQCPNCNAHSNPNEPVNGSTVIKLPNHVSREAKFVCSHSHCRDLSRSQGLAFVLMGAPLQITPEINKSLSADEIQAIATGITQEQSAQTAITLDHTREAQRTGQTVEEVAGFRSNASAITDDGYWKSLVVDADTTWQGPDFDEYGLAVEEHHPGGDDEYPEANSYDVDFPEDTPPPPLEPVAKGLAALIKAGRERIKASGWIVDQIIPERSVGFMYGDSGTKKTFMALHMGLCIARGEHFAGLGVRPGRVFYFSPEDFDGVSERYTGWIEKYNGGKLLDRFTLTRRSLPLHDHTAIKALVGMFRQDMPDEEVGLVVIDTLSSNNAGAAQEIDENNNPQMAKVLQGAQLLADGLDCGVMIIHHVGNPDQKTKRKSDRMRGASCLRANAGYLIFLEQAGKDIRFSIKKSKGVDRLPPRLFETEIVRLPEWLITDKHKSRESLTHGADFGENGWRITPSEITLAIRNEPKRENSETAPQEDSPTMLNAKELATMLMSSGNDGRMLKSELRDLAKATWPERYQNKRKADNDGKPDMTGTNNFNNAIKTAVREKLITEAAGDILVFGGAAARLKDIRSEKPLPSDWSAGDENEQGEEEEF